MWFQSYPLVRDVPCGSATAAIKAHLHDGLKRFRHFREKSVWNEEQSVKNTHAQKKEIPLLQYVLITSTLVEVITEEVTRLCFQERLVCLWKIHNYKNDGWISMTFSEPACTVLRAGIAATGRLHKWFDCDVFHFLKTLLAYTGTHREAHQKHQRGVLLHPHWRPEFRWGKLFSI